MLTARFHHSGAVWCRVVRGGMCGHTTPHHTTPHHEDYITKLSTAYDVLTNKTLEKLAERDAKLDLASALSALDLLDSNLTSARAAISARNSDFASIQTTLAARDAELATLHPQLAQLRASAALAEQQFRGRHASYTVEMAQLRSANAPVEREWRECHTKQTELQEELLQHQAESTRLYNLIQRNNLNAFFYAPAVAERIHHLPRSSPSGPEDPDTDSPDNRLRLARPTPQQLFPATPTHHHRRVGSRDRSSAAERRSTAYAYSPSQ